MQIRWVLRRGAGGAHDSNHRCACQRNTNAGTEPAGRVSRWENQPSDLYPFGHPASGSALRQCSVRNGAGLCAPPLVVLMSCPDWLTARKDRSSPIHRAGLFLRYLSAVVLPCLPSSDGPRERAARPCSGDLSAPGGRNNDRRWLPEKRRPECAVVSTVACRLKA